MAELEPYIEEALTRMYEEAEPPLDFTSVLENPSEMDEDWYEQHHLSPDRQEAICAEIEEEYSLSDRQKRYLYMESILNTEEHQPLYKANLEMQEVLRDIALSEDWHNQDPDGDFYQEVWRVSRELQEKLILNEEILREDTRLISEYLRLVRQAVAATCAMDDSQIDESIQSELYSLADIYHDPVWKLAAMRISSTTVHGRNKRTKQSEFCERADDLQGDVRGTISAHRVNLQKTGLLWDRTKWSLSNEELGSYTRQSESAFLS